jgi:hypothetical protein
MEPVKSQLNGIKMIAFYSALNSRANDNLSRTEAKRVSIA